MMSQFQAIDAGADISMPAPIATRLPSLQCLPVPTLSMPVPCSYWSPSLTMPAGATSVHQYLPHPSFKN